MSVCRCRMRTKAQRGGVLWESDYGWWLGQRRHQVSDCTEVISVDVGITILVVFCPWCGKQLPRKK